MSHSITIRVVPFQPHCFAFGGFDLQMIGAMNATRNASFDIGPLDVWRRTADFDIIHFWGFDVAHFHIAYWAQAANKKLVMSALLPFPSFISYLRNLGAVVASSTRLRFEMLPLISALTVVNAEQARYAVKILGLAADRVHVIPNIVDDIFFDPPSNADGFNVGFNDYVLCVGNICKRKNQLMLVKACRKLGVPLLLVGDVLVGEEEYGKAVAEAMRGVLNMDWIRGLPAGSDALAAAYRNCLVFALPSYSETQPISALEAAAAGKSVLLANRSYARQEFFAKAVLVSPKSEINLINGLKRVMDDPSSYCTPRNILERCRRENVGKAYRDVYSALRYG